MYCKYRWFMLIGFFILSVNIFGGEYQIIVNHSRPEQKVTKNMLRNIFLGKQAKWENGQRISPAIVNIDEPKKVFIKEILGKTPAAYKNYWNKQLFTGQGVPPAAFDSDEALIQYIHDNPGAIGVISGQSVADDIKVVEIVEK